VIGYGFFRDEERYGRRRFGLSVKSYYNSPKQGGSVDEVWYGFFMVDIVGVWGGGRAAVWRVAYAKPQYKPGNTDFREGVSPI
jgi:hypothetical protein